MSAVGIEHYHFDIWKAPMNGFNQFFGVKVRKAAVQEQHLPVSSFQLDQGLSAAQRLLYRARIVQTVNHLFA